MNFFILNLLIIFFVINNGVSKKIIKIGAIFDTNELDLLNEFKIIIEDFNEKSNEIQLVPTIRIDESSNYNDSLACELFSNGTVAVFGSNSNNPNAMVIESLCNLSGVPYIKFDSYNIDDSPKKNTNDMIINIYPSIKTISKVYTDILGHMKWKKFALIYQNDVGNVI
ncbi:glutamate receptor ionotropic, kainate 2-like [Condylostylus longicornis]|uniref:glutamate receptor ionotropic, kainate 2-like n=1 Tax=Condylostylus longicornis TaxID=2530218 RepID=UPI00244DEBA4|nr:glutamate receptor ionotropic, kainate 2-like [Condylostylus longicornis]